MPNDWRYFLYRNIGAAVAILIAVIINRLMTKKSKSSPDYEPSDNGISLECPSCHCPHSWVMVKSQNIVEKVETKTTTTTRTPSAESYGGGAIGQAFAGASSSTSTSVHHTYKGKFYKLFECLNCGKTQKTEGKKTWEDEEPNQDVVEYNPPVDSWEASDVGKTNLKTLGVFALVIIIAIWSILSDLTKAQWEASTAAETPVAQTDTSLNGVGVSKHQSIIAWKDVSSQEREKAFDIPKGEFFTILGKSGKFTKLEYKGSIGYAESSEVKKFTASPIAVVTKNNDIYILTEPRQNSPTLARVWKGVKLTLLGENVDGYIKVDYYGKPGWIKNNNLKW
jgi:hypothetical protein